MGVEVLYLRKDNKKEKENILEKTASMFDLPGEVVAGLPKVTVTGCRKIYIENHKGILEYGSDAITVNCGKIILKLRGSELELRSMSDSEMLITGFLTGIEFEL